MGDGGVIRREIALAAGHKFGQRDSSGMLPFCACSTRTIAAVPAGGPISQRALARGFTAGAVKG